ncbi:hypothetical protein VTI74DRAFT_6197 [Chaetomium olivicolor]
MSTHASLPLLTNRIALSEALDQEDSVLVKLSSPEKRLDFFCHLHTHTYDIKATASHHSCAQNLGQDSLCGQVAPWQLNMCIPLYVEGARQVMIRLPLPYKIRESTFPGNTEGKPPVRGGHYAWIESRCPSAPIPRLWGFAFPDGPSASLKQCRTWDACLAETCPADLADSRGASLSSPYSNKHLCSGGSVGTHDG